MKCFILPRLHVFTVYLYFTFGVLLLLQYYSLYSDTHKNYLTKVTKQIYFDTYQLWRRVESILLQTLTNSYKLLQTLTKYWEAEHTSV